MVAVATEERELVLAKPHHHLAIYLKYFCPGLLDKILQRRSKVN